VIAGVLPLYGTWFICTPTRLLKNSTARWMELPAEPYDRVPGLALARRTRSASVRAWTLGCTATTRGWMASIDTGTKLVSGSYGSRANVAALTASVEMLPTSSV
jgi:hypothetical protein